MIKARLLADHTIAFVLIRPAQQSDEVKITCVQVALRDIEQSNRIVVRVGDDRIGAGRSHMILQIGKIAEYRLIDLDRVLSGLEICDGVVSEQRFKDKRVVAASTVECVVVAVARDPVVEV